jgi:hypothetical protein
VGYFDELATLKFKKDAEGRDLFYPFGILGKGSVLPDQETAARFRRNAVTFAKLNMLFTASLVGWMTAGFQLPITYAGRTLLGMLTVGAMLSIGMWTYYFKITRGMAVAERQTCTERRLAARQWKLATRRPRRMEFLALSAVAFAGEGVPGWMGIGPMGLEGRAISGVFLIASLVCIAILARMIAADRRHS